MSISPERSPATRVAASGIRRIDELLEAGGLSPVIGDRFEPMIVALLPLDVPVGPGADRMQGRLLLADRLQVFLRGDVLVSHELGEVRGDLPHAVLEVHDHRELVGSLDPFELVAKEGPRSPRHVRPQVLLDGELDILRRQLAPVLVKRHTRPELKSPRSQLVGGLPFRGQPGPIGKRLGVTLDERIVDAVPQGLFGLTGAPGKWGLDAPLANGHDEPVAGCSRAEGHDKGRAHQGGGRACSPPQKRTTIDRSRHDQTSVTVRGTQGGAFP